MSRTYDESSLSPAVLDSPEWARTWVHAGQVVQAAVQQPNGDVWVGHGIDMPQHPRETAIGTGEVQAVLFKNGGGGQIQYLFQGLKGDGSGDRLDLMSLVVTHENGGSGVSRIRIYAGDACTAGNLPLLAINPDGSLETKHGVRTDGAGFFVNNIRVLGGQQPAITHLAGSATLPQVVAALNQLLSSSEAHGFLAVPT